MVRSGRSIDEGDEDMSTQAASRRVTGPLKTWYDMHEALSHGVSRG
jgi:hypothetical protein